jgi:Lon protease-like protein
MSTPFARPEDCPEIIPVFPLSRALLLPRGQMPLNIFEPRYLAMVDSVLGGPRVIGMIQPESDADPADPAPRLCRVGCAGRIMQFGEPGDGRYLISLVGMARFRLVEELPVSTPFRQCRVDFAPFAIDFQARAGEAEVDRAGVIAALRAFAEATGLKVDWKGIEEAPNEALVNALSMMSPFGTREKQALLEAPDLKTRAEMLIAVTEMELAKGQPGPDTILQ